MDETKYGRKQHLKVLKVMRSNATVSTIKRKLRRFKVRSKTDGQPQPA